MPAVVKNVTAKLETLVKAMGYLYLSENQQPQSPVQQNQIKLWARMTPNKQFVSIHISQLQSILKFENIKTNQVVRTILPPTATNTIVGNVQRRLLRSQLHPTCQLERKYVNTFDNVTYSFNAKVVQACETLLAKDCSGGHPMAVYLKNIGKQVGQELTILLGEQTKITLIPRGVFRPRRESSKSSTKSRVVRESEAREHALVNGQYVELPHVIYAKGSRNAEPIAEIMRTPPYGEIQVISRHIKVAFDGLTTVLSVNGLLRNRTCGICGDMDNEKVAEMRSPRDAPLSSGSLLIASYSFDLGSVGGQTGKGSKGSSQDKCQIHPRYERQVQIEEEMFQSKSKSQYTSKNQQRGQTYIKARQQLQMQQAQEVQTLQGRLQGFMTPARNMIDWIKSPFHKSQSAEYSTERSRHRSSKSRQINNRSFEQSDYERRVLTAGRTTTERTGEWGHASTAFPLRYPAILNAPQSIIYRQLAIPQANQMCFTMMKVPACAPGHKSVPSYMADAQTKAYCMPQGPEAEQIESEINRGQFRTFADSKVKVINISVPRRCDQN